MPHGVDASMTRDRVYRSSDVSTSAGFVGISDADYGFAPSWPAIPVPLLPSTDGVARATPKSRQGQDLSSLVNAAAQGHNNATHGSDGAQASSQPSCASPNPNQHQQQHQRQHSRERCLCPSLTSGKRGPDADMMSDYSPTRGMGTASSSATTMPASAGERRGTSSDSNRSTGTGREAAAAAAAAVMAALATGADDGNSSRTSHRDSPRRGAHAAGGPQEQVSLPEDIYGAARVSEYWHGMHALSSLASSYVYDDIWAGAGGLNPREDVSGIAAWAVGGGVGHNQERGSEGDAATESKEGRDSEVPPHPLGRRAISHGARTIGHEEDGFSEHRKRWRRRRPAASGEAKEWQRHGCSGDVEDSSRAADDAGSRKRRTPSPGSARQGPKGHGVGPGLPSVASASGRLEGATAVGGDTTLVQWCKRMVNSPPLSFTGSTSGASSGEEESFFADRVLDPAPRPLPNAAYRKSTGWGEPDLSIDRPHAAVAAAASAGAVPMASSGKSAEAGRSGHGDEETFFASHALEPNPRPGWNRDAFVEGRAGDEAARAVAKGIVVHGLAQGIGEKRPSEGSEGLRVPEETPRSDGGGRSFRSTADAWAWSRARGEDEQRASRRQAAAAAEAAKEASDSAEANCGAGDWEIQPEAMSSYFTSVIGLAAPAVGSTPSRPQRGWARSRTGPLASSEHHDSARGGAGGGAGGAAPEIEEEATEACGGAESRPEMSVGSAESCGMSWSADIGGAGEEGNIWGW